MPIHIILINGTIWMQNQYLSFKKPPPLICTVDIKTFDDNFFDYTLQ